MGNCCAQLLHRLGHLRVGRRHLAPRDLLLQQAHRDQIVQHAAVDLIALLRRHRPPCASLDVLDGGLELGALDLLAVHLGDDGGQLCGHGLRRRRGVAGAGAGAGAAGAGAAAAGAVARVSTAEACADWEAAGFWQAVAAARSTARQTYCCFTGTSMEDGSAAS